MKELVARWNRIKEIFVAASECTPAERPEVISRLAAGDKAIEREVLRLLSLSESLGSFLDRPALGPSEVSDSMDFPADFLLAGRYRITELLGRGGMGEVYEAIDEVVAERVAVKIVRPGTEPPHKAAARWKRELQLARKVSHSSVCRVHDIGTYQHDGADVVFLTMERLKGDSLYERLAGGDMTLAAALEIIRQVAAALDASHQQGVLHRDIKPQNIMIEPKPDGRLRAVVTDFGLARDLEQPDIRITQTGWIAGTIGYVAPELLRGEAPSVATDLYAFGVVVRELVTTTVPEPAPSVSALFERALHDDPRARFRSAGDFASAVERALHSPAPSKVLRRIAALLAVLALSAVAFRCYS